MFEFESIIHKNDNIHNSSAHEAKDKTNKQTLIYQQSTLEEVRYY